MVDDEQGGSSRTSATRADVQPLLAELRLAGGDSRRHLLDNLRQQLANSKQREDVVGSLAHASNDVRRVALTSVAQRLEPQDGSGGDAEWLTAAGLLHVVLAAGMRSLPGAGTSLSACQTSSAALHATRSLVEVSSMAPASGDANNIIEFALTCASVGLPARSAPVSVRAVRQTPGSAFAFGRTPGRTPSRVGVDVQRLPYAGNAGSSERFGIDTLHRQSSSSSLKSLGALSIASSNTALSEHEQSAASASETDNDAQQHGDQAPRRLIAAQRNVRKEATSTFLWLVNRCPGALLARWPDMLCERSAAARACLLDIAELDLFATNRVAACRTIEAILSSGARLGFLTGVEERRRATFTSLSNRIATAIVETRARLNALLLSPCPVVVADALIRCMKVLVESTRKVKLLASHASIVRPTALRLCSRQEPSIAIAAFALLAALPDRTGLETLPDIESVILPTLTGPDEEARVNAWQMLAQTVSSEAALTEKDIATLIELAKRNLAGSSDTTLREAVAAFVLGLCKHMLHFDGLDVILEQMCTDGAPSVRTLAADALAHRKLSRTQQLLLVQDAESAVRAAAVRAIGVRAQTQVAADDMDDVLASLADPSPLVRARASWALGNVCETTARLDAHSRRIEILHACLELRDQDERVAVHGVRGAGASLSAYSYTQLTTHRDQLASFLAWLHRIITAVREPKMRWNALAAFERMLRAISVDDDTERTSNELRAQRCAFMLATMRDECHVAPLELLSQVVATDNIFKTRLAACNALVTACEAGQTIILEHASSDVLRSSINAAIEDVATQLATASFKEAQMHVTPLQQTLERLQSLLKIRETDQVASGVS